MTVVMDRKRLGHSHRQTLRLTLFRRGQPIAYLPNPTTGSISLSTDQGALRTCSLRLVDVDGSLSPGISKLLRPGVAEVFIEMGIDDPFGNLTYYPLGMYGIATIQASKALDAMGPYVDITGTDRSMIIGASTLTQTLQTPDSTRLAAITAEVFTQQVPWIPESSYLLDDGGYSINSQLLSQGSNPWDTVRQWWTDSGCLLYFDPSGNLIGKPFDKSLQADPVVYKPGPGTTLSGFNDAWDANGVYNGATVVASYPGATPVSATVWDTDPASPTYVEDFGYRPAPPVSSATSRSKHQCESAAQLLLPNILGYNRILTTTQVPDPSLEGWMMAYISDVGEQNSGDIGILGWWILTTFTMPVDLSGPMSTTWKPAGVSVA